MSHKIIDCDNDAQWAKLKQVVACGYGPGALPRKTKYGSAPGLKPVGNYPDMLVDPKDLKEVIQHCRKHKLFPVFHQHKTWCPPGDLYTQNGTNYCWSFAGGAAFMDLQAREGKRKAGDELLAPITMGWIVKWRNVGGHLETFIRGMQDRGMAPLSCVPHQHSRDYRRYADDWKEQALKNRLAKDSVFDADPRNMLQHAVTILRTGTSGYAAWNHMGHAMSVVGMKWDESKYNNVIWEIRNSHYDKDVIEMSGRRAQPDELYGLNASVT